MAPAAAFWGRISNLRGVPPPPPPPLLLNTHWKVERLLTPNVYFRSSKYNNIPNQRFGCLIREIDKFSANCCLLRVISILLPSMQNLATSLPITRNRQLRDFGTTHAKEPFNVQGFPSTRAFSWPSLLGSEFAEVFHETATNVHRTLFSTWCRML